MSSSISFSQAAKIGAAFVCAGFVTEKVFQLWNARSVQIATPQNTDPDAPGQKVLPTENKRGTTQKIATFVMALGAAAFTAQYSGVVELRTLPSNALHFASSVYANFFHTSKA